MCALKLRELGRALDKHRHASQAHLAAPHWCDSLLGKGWNAGDFTCPGADEGDCHYAMNVNGRPEFFTFDNHEPAGGCILLNGGTVKFIRTEGELQTLRWK